MCSTVLRTVPTTLGSRAPSSVGQLCSRDRLYLKHLLLSFQRGRYPLPSSLWTALLGCSPSTRGRRPLEFGCPLPLASRVLPYLAAFAMSACRVSSCTGGPRCSSRTSGHFDSVAACAATRTGVSYQALYVASDIYEFSRRSNFDTEQMALLPGALAGAALWKQCAGSHPVCSHSGPLSRGNRLYLPLARPALQSLNLLLTLSLDIV